jgi:hypothetical protein
MLGREEKRQGSSFGKESLGDLDSISNDLNYKPDNDLPHGRGPLATDQLTGRGLCPQRQGPSVSPRERIPTELDMTPRSTQKDLRTILFLSSSS